MKLECKIGSLSCDGVLAEKGDIFELSDDVAAGIIKSGYAVEVLDIMPVDPLDDMEMIDDNKDVQEQEQPTKTKRRNR